MKRSDKEFPTLAEGGITVNEAAKLIGDVDPEVIRQRLTSSPPTLYGIKSGEAWILPKFQFDDRGEIPNIGKVISRLDPSLHPLAVERWFAIPNPDLEPEGEASPLSPLDWLKRGYEVSEVVRIAEAL